MLDTSWIRVLSRLLIMGSTVACGSAKRDNAEPHSSGTPAQTNVAEDMHAAEAPLPERVPEELDPEPSRCAGPCGFSVDCWVLTATHNEGEGLCEPDAKLICKAGQCMTASDETELDEASVPVENKVGIEPPPRPPVGDADERSERLLQAIVHDEPALAADFFFPQEAFRKVKAIAKPDRYWKKLYARYEKDIHTLHTQLGDVEPEDVKFERLQIVKRGGWVKRGEEGNALPYWAARHNWLHYTRDGKPEKIEVRVVITWGTRWYITHLSEFH